MCFEETFKVRILFSFSGVFSRRLRVPEGRRGQGDVHHQTWQAGRRGRRR